MVISVSEGLSFPDYYIGAGQSKAVIHTTGAD